VEQLRGGARADDAVRAVAGLDLSTRGVEVAAPLEAAAVTALACATSARWEHVQNLASGIVSLSPRASVRRPTAYGRQRSGGASPEWVGQPSCPPEACRTTLTPVQSASELSQVLELPCSFSRGWQSSSSQPTASPMDLRTIGQAVVQSFAKGSALRSRYGLSPALFCVRRASRSRHLSNQRP
jgi:hypothetical protein